MRHANDSRKMKGLWGLILKAITCLLLAFTSTVAVATDYYISPSGSDGANGTSPVSAWQTIARVNEQDIDPGDRVLFQGGATFTGNLLLDASDSGTPGSPVVITSFDLGRATIDAGDGNGIYAYDCGGIEIRNLNLVGSYIAPPGPKEENTNTNTGIGVYFYTDRTDGTKFEHIRIDEVDASGFLRAGIAIKSKHSSLPGYRNVEITRCRAFSNGRTGIQVGGFYNNNTPALSHEDVRIAHCEVFDNKGDTDVTDNHTGSGIILSATNGAVIEFCHAYNNGEYNTSGNNGPVGIWAWQANDVIIQFNISHHNKSFSNKDGGGFDFDGGTTNSIMQYNYSYQNQGPGYLLAQFGGLYGAPPYHDNVFRYNISYNDGRDHNGGFLLWAGASISNIDIYGNTIYLTYPSPDTPSAASSPVGVYNGSYSNISVRNNIFITEPDLPLIRSNPDLSGPDPDIHFQGNAYWNSAGDGGFEVEMGGQYYYSLEAWQAIGQEMVDDMRVGLYGDPKLVSPTSPELLTDPTQLTALSAFKLQSDSPVIDKGLQFDPGPYDFYGVPLPQGAALDIGVAEYSGSNPNPNPLEIDADFDSGSIGPYTIDGDVIELTINTETLVNTSEEYSYWANFRVLNAQEKTITFNISNANLVPFLSETTNNSEMVYSCDAGATWNRITNHSYAATNYTFSETFSCDEVQIATFFPFSHERMIDYVDDRVSLSEWATVAVLGSSLQGRDIDLLTITNPGIAAENKKQIYIIGRQHAAETASSHMLEGMIDFLISDGPDAQVMRDNFEWYIVPIVNPDGVSNGNSRGTSEHSDPNRLWDNYDSVEVNIVRDSLEQIHSDFVVEMFIDWHSQMNDAGWYNFIYSPPDNTFFSVLSSWTNFDQEKTLETSCTTTSCSARGYATELGLFTFVLEPTPHLSTWTRESLNQEGINTAYAITDYFGAFQIDTAPPDPDPMIWAVSPSSTGSSSISMTATTASDENNVEYYFMCTSGGCQDSGWQDNSTYENTGLSPNTQYTYSVKARDLSPNQNETGWSAPASATTLEESNTPPTATITQPLESAIFTFGETINYAGDGTDPEDGILPASAFTWTAVGGGQTYPLASDIKSGAVTIPLGFQPGDYRIVLEILDSQGAIDTNQVTITIGQATNLSPTAVAEADPTSGSAPLTVNFTGSNSSDSDGTITDYLWDFGDGNSSDQANPPHTYQTPATYTAVLTVTDDGSATDIAEIIITVNPPGNTPPTATITQPLESAIFTFGETINYAGDGTDPEDGILPASAFTWTAVGGGQTYPLTVDVKSGAVVIPFGFQPGDYRIVLEIVDSQGAIDTNQVTITIGQTTNLSPTAVAEADSISGSAPLTVNFTSSNSFDSDGTITNYLWDFGDGNSSDQANPPHTYQTPATYTAVLTVTDDGSATDIAEVIITVNPPGNTPPTATITQPLESAIFTFGETLNYAGDGTDPEDGILPASAFTWTAVGGGQTYPLASDIKSGSVTIPLGFQPGDYRIVLEIVDSQGGIDTDQVTITVGQ